MCPRDPPALRNGFREISLEAKFLRPTNFRVPASFLPPARVLAEHPMLQPLSSSALRRRTMLLAWMVVAALPVAYVAGMAALFSRNIVFWDEFDTALDLILRIDAGAGWRELLQRFFAISNEHRMVTSRLLFAGSYWLTGTVNFHVIGAIGNLFLVGACAILVCFVSGWERRVRLGVVLAFLMFQLEHFENFLWSGASIDHFQVVMLGVGAIAAAARGSARALVLSALLALLATFTLAHGTLAWPVVAALLVQQRRWKHLGAWIAGAALAGGAFLYGFEFNPGHQFEDPSPQYVSHIVRYWLALLGGPLTLGDAGFAPLPGLVLLASLGLLAARGALTHEPVAMFSAVFAVCALGLVAIGRAELAGPEINSRYMVLGALAWALLIFMLLELEATPAKPFRALVCLLPALAAFNVAANARFAPLAESFIEVRDRAATAFKQHGIDGRGLTRLHPRDGHADVLLRLAAERGVYTLPTVSHFVTFPQPRPRADIIAHVDQFLATDRAITIGGWGMLKGVPSRRGQVHVVLRSEKSFLVLTTVTLQRPDVAKAYNEPRWRLSGFRAVLSPARLPAEDFEVGVLLADGDETIYVMTPHRLLLSSGRPQALRRDEKPTS